MASFQEVILWVEDYNRVTAPIIAFDRNLSPEIPVVFQTTTLEGSSQLKPSSRLGLKTSS